MLKAVLIGTAGHFHYALDAIVDGAPCEVVAMAPGPEKEFREDVKTHLNARYYDDYRTMLNETNADIAIVNPQFSYISECACEALKRGINTFCEKPVALNWEQMGELERTLERSSARLCAMMGMRYFPPFYALQNLIEGGELGRVRLIHAQKSYKLGERPDFYKARDTYGGTIPWIGSHAVDLIYWMSGRKRFSSVSAAHSAMENRGHGDVEVSASLFFELEDEISATASIDYLRPEDSPTHGDDRIRVVGSENWAEIVDEKLYLGGKEIGVQTPKNIFYGLCAELLGECECSISNEDSIYVTKACLWARDAADSGEKKTIGEQK